jgi:hypothetical protein
MRKSGLRLLTAALGSANVIDSMIQSRVNLSDRKWERKRLNELGLYEADLENVIYRNHELLCLERLGLIVDRVHLVQQAGATDLMGDSKYPDLMFLTDRGDVGIVEVKRFGNQELRGRHVISQVLDYGATLCSLAETQQAALLSKSNPPAERLEDLARELVVDSSRARWIAKSYRDRLRQAQLHYIIVCDEAPEGLADWIRTASRNDATDYQISVLEVSPFVVEGQENEIIWLSQPVVRTETIHRTTVRVIRDEESGELAVTVASDSPESIAERVASNQPRDSKNERLLRESMEQLSEQNGLPAQTLLSALDAANQEGLQTNWQWALDRFAEPGCKKPVYLRGTGRPGLVEGRLGVNLAHPHHPGIFIGQYHSPHDHYIEPVAKAKGGDFSVVLDVSLPWGKRFKFWECAEYLALCERLEAQASRWTFSQGENSWHPIMLHRPMAEAFTGVKSESDIVERWLELAREGLEIMLAGNELQELRDRLQAQEAST